MRVCDICGGSQIVGPAELILNAYVCDDPPLSPAIKAWAGDLCFGCRTMLENKANLPDALAYLRDPTKWAPFLPPDRDLFGPTETGTLYSGGTIDRPEENRRLARHRGDDLGVGAEAWDEPDATGSYV
jgi:hypothetical protein